MSRHFLYVSNFAMEILLVIWFSLTAVSLGYVTYDLVTSTPEMKVMKWGWMLVTLYTGVFGLAIYLISCREPAPNTHERFIAPLWKQAVGSTIHCMAGDATGVIVVAFITAALNLPMWLDSILEYLAGFAFGLFIFQALFMKGMLGGSYAAAVRKTWYPELMSMNFVMAGMIPVMIILMTANMQNMEVSSLRFWGIMSLSALVGGCLAFPVNWWMVKYNLKHGMGTERALGKGGESLSKTGKNDNDMAGMSGHSALQKSELKIGNTEEMAMPMKASVSLQTKLFVAIVSLMILGLGIAAAAHWGEYKMRPVNSGHTMKM
jgi:hypothetical protein